MRLVLGKLWHKHRLAPANALDLPRGCGQHAALQLHFPPWLHGCWRQELRWRWKQKEGPTWWKGVSWWRVGVLNL